MADDGSAAAASHSSTNEFSVVGDVMRRASKSGIPTHTLGSSPLKIGHVRSSSTASYSSE